MADFSDVDNAFDDFDNEIHHEMEEAGKAAVAYAAENGDYTDKTGNLRASNNYEVERDGLVLRNEADYASYVEAKGFDVLSGAVLEAERILRSKCE